jgi:hypothetical protein
MGHLNSFFRVAKNNRRCPAISLKQASLLNSLHTDTGLSLPDLNVESLLIFRKSKVISYAWKKQILEQYVAKLSSFDLPKH